MSNEIIDSRIISENSKAIKIKALIVGLSAWISKNMSIFRELIAHTLVEDRVPRQASTSQISDVTCHFMISH